MPINRTRMGRVHTGLAIISSSPGRAAFDISGGYAGIINLPDQLYRLGVPRVDPPQVLESSQEAQACVEGWGELLLCRRCGSAGGGAGHNCCNRRSKSQVPGPWEQTPSKMKRNRQNENQSVPDSSTALSALADRTQRQLSAPSRRHHYWCSIAASCGFPLPVE